MLTLFRQSSESCPHNHGGSTTASMICVRRINQASPYELQLQQDTNSNLSDCREPLALEPRLHRYQSPGQGNQLALFLAFLIYSEASTIQIPSRKKHTPNLPQLRHLSPYAHALGFRRCCCPFSPFSSQAKKRRSSHVQPLKVV